MCSNTGGHQTGNQQLVLADVHLRFGLPALVLRGSIQNVQTGHKTYFDSVDLPSHLIREAAERLAASLRDKGFSVYVSPGARAGEARWRVRVGPLATREEAERAASRLKKVEKLPPWILSEDAS